VDPAKPSLELLRSLTDEHVLRALMRQQRLTRAELAAETGISKPTVSESVRRLVDAGLVADTGQRSAGGRGRGRVGSYYALADSVGVALAVSIAPEGIVAECIDAHGDTIARAQETISRPARPVQVAAALRTAAKKVRRAAGLAPRLAVVSAADPVDRATGRTVHLPDAPFLLGELDPAQILARHIDGPVAVDNDVNWAAQAERDHAGTTALDDFAYLFLGEGLGCAIISDGRVRRGHTGLRGQALPFIEVFSELGLRQTASTAIDAERLLTAATGPEPQAAATRYALSQAVGGVLAAISALSDPELIIIGGSWGSRPVILETIAADTARLGGSVPIRGAALTDNPSLAGARIDALCRLRSDIITAPHRTAGD